MYGSTAVHRLADSARQVPRRVSHPQLSVNVTQPVADGDTVVALGTYTWNRKDSGCPPK